LQFPIAARENDDLNQAINGEIERAAVKIVAEFAAQRKSSAPNSPDVASRWLRAHSLTKLVGNLPEASITRLRNALADAWSAGGSVNQLVRAIHAVFPDLSDQQAAIIAQTEANTAYNVGRLALAREVGAQEKSWSADGTDACDDCRQQIAAGWIPIDDPFPGGVVTPCLHEGCDCGVDFRGTSKADRGTGFSRINEVERMIREGREEEAEATLLELVAAMEQEAQVRGGRVAPWHYERLAIIYRRRRDYASEVAILTRYYQYEGAKEGIQKRLDKARGLLAKAEEATHPGR
jgi:hypothetical protein